MKKTLESMYDAAHTLDVVKGGMNLNKVLIEDITREMEQFSEEATNAHPELAEFYLSEVQSKLRLLTTLLQVAAKDMNAEYEALSEISSYVFANAEKPRAEEGSHTYPFIDAKKA